MLDQCLEIYTVLCPHSPFDVTLHPRRFILAYTVRIEMRMWTQPSVKYKAVDRNNTVYIYINVRVFRAMFESTCLCESGRHYSIKK
jgi:hypothetical protein